MLVGMARGLVPVIGTVVAVGPVELALYDTTYSYAVIEKEDGTVRDFAMVHATYEVSGLVERDAVGTFVFWMARTNAVWSSSTATLARATPIARR
jgi:hypothetical protein